MVAYLSPTLNHLKGLPGGYRLIDSLEEFAGLAAAGGASLAMCTRLDAQTLTASLTKPTPEACWLVDNVSHFYGAAQDFTPNGWGRFNGWPMGAGVTRLELADRPPYTAAWVKALNEAQIPFTLASDVTGLITPRITYMIVSEAVRLLNEGVASREDINTSMRLGTNYPLGPFEWLDLWGKERFDALTQALMQENPLRYLAV